MVLAGMRMLQRNAQFVTAADRRRQLCDRTVSALPLLPLYVASLDVQTSLLV